MEGAVDVVRADIGDRHDLDEVRVEAANQDVALVAGADDADANRVFELGAVAKVHGTETSPGRDSGGDCALA